MSRMAVIYWSMTGNTEAMANAIAEGAAGAGAEVDVKQVCDTTVDEALGYGLLALGCPAMGAEVLEEAEFEPFFTELEGRLGGKKVAHLRGGLCQVLKGPDQEKEDGCLPKRVSVLFFL